MPKVNRQPATLEAGTGPDALVLQISQDAYQGNAQYTVKVDGVQLGGTFTASAWHSSGKSDTLTLQVKGTTDQVILTEYLTELTRTECRHTMRPNFFAIIGSIAFWISSIANRPAY